VIRIAILAFLLVVALLEPAARAEVEQVTAHTMRIKHRVATTAAPGAVFKALGQIDRWWSPKHTYSGSAGSLSLKTEAGGCFCERWPDGSVEHGRVVEVRKDRLVRLQAPLGPLLELGVGAILTFTLEPNGSGTTLLLTYRVTGDATHGLPKLAPVVDQVLGEQVKRLAKLVDTGKPE
jgi:uncharacterized protein YndB with AHSA1/START domain